MKIPFKPLRTPEMDSISLYVVVVFFIAPIYPCMLVDLGKAGKYMLITDDRIPINSHLLEDYRTKVFLFRVLISTLYPICYI